MVVTDWKTAMIIFSYRTFQHYISRSKVKIDPVSHFPFNPPFPAMMDANISGAVKSSWRAADHVEIIIHDSDSGIHLIEGGGPISCFIFHLIYRARFLPAEQIHILL